MKLAIPLLLAVLFFMACGKEPELLHPLPEMEEEVQSESFGVKFIFSDSAQQAVVLKSKRVIEKKEKGTNQTILYFYDGLDIDFLDKKGTNRSRATAREGIYYREKQFAELKGDVTLTNAKGDRLETQLLYWDENKDSVYTRKPVRVISPTRSIHAANGLTANTSFTAWTLFNISGALQADPAIVD